MLMRRSKWAIELSFLLQALQVVHIAYERAEYSIYSGASYYIAFVPPTLRQSFNIGSGVDIKLTSEYVEPTFALNLVALWAAWYLFSRIDKSEEETTSTQVSA